jgi:hypothetical protein
MYTSELDGVNKTLYNLYKILIANPGNQKLEFDSPGARIHDAPGKQNSFPSSDFAAGIGRFLTSQVVFETSRTQKRVRAISNSVPTDEADGLGE